MSNFTSVAVKKCPDKNQLRVEILFQLLIPGYNVIVVMSRPEFQTSGHIISTVKRAERNE